MNAFLAMWLGSFFAKAKDEKGQGLVEYALIIALVSIVLVVALQALQIGIADVFARIVTAFG